MRTTLTEVITLLGDNDRDTRKASLEAIGDIST